MGIKYSCNDQVIDNDEITPPNNKNNQKRKNHFFNVIKGFDATDLNKESLQGSCDYSCKITHSTIEPLEIEEMNVKIVMIGDPFVGKTCLQRKYFEKNFSDNCPSTIGVNLAQKIIKNNKFRINAKIWDCAGGDRYDNVTNQSLRDSDAAIIVFDLFQRESFKNLKNWLKAFYIANGNEYKVITVVANKADLKKNQIPLVSSMQMENLVYEFHDTYPFYSFNIMETSAFNGMNVDVIFNHIYKEIYFNKEKFKKEDDDDDFVIINLNEKKTKKFNKKC